MENEYTEIEALDCQISITTDVSGDYYVLVYETSPGMTETAVVGVTSESDLLKAVSKARQIWIEEEKRLAQIAKTVDNFPIGLLHENGGN